VAVNNHPAPEDHPDLREALKRCSPATYYAACRFRQTGHPEHLHAVMLGIVERYVDRDARPKLQAPDGALRLREDLGLDSLTMMEIVMLAEEVFPLSVSNAELTRLCTWGDVRSFFEAKLGEQPLPVPAHAVPRHASRSAGASSLAAPAAEPGDRLAG
jgi:acyl carrier protein